MPHEGFGFLLHTELVAVPCGCFLAFGEPWYQHLARRLLPCRQVGEDFADKGGNVVLLQQGEQPSPVGTFGYVVLSASERAAQ